MSNTTTNCIRACLNGHPEAFKSLVQRYERPLIGYLTRRLSDREQAEEVAQESFVRAYFSLSRLRVTASFYSWLLGIANRVASEQQRADRRRRQVEANAPPHVAATLPVAEHDALDAALAELSEPYAQVIMLRYYSGLSCREVAEATGVPLGTVTKRLSRAHALLRDALRRTDNET